MKNTVAAKDPQRIVVSLELTGQARKLADISWCIEPPVSGSGRTSSFTNEVRRSARGQAKSA
jgi:hypothetical protein